MTDPAINSNSVKLATALLKYYSFDLAGNSIERNVETWKQHYPLAWLGTAVVEALYQGRYKAVSVGQILQIWSRRGHPICHFTEEFEQMVCAPVLPMLPQASGSPSLDRSDIQADVQGYPPFVHNGADRPKESSQSAYASQPDAHSTSHFLEPVSHDPYLCDHFEKAEQLVSTDSPTSPHHRDKREAIHQFVPHVTPSSGFYNRLQAIARSDNASDATNSSEDLSSPPSWQPSSEPSSSDNAQYEAPQDKSTPSTGSPLL
jgi:hypothetical protein